MSRDLVDYQEQYFKQPYEKYQVAFRKRKLKEILSGYAHGTILEVGCGLESLFLDLDTYDQFVVIEPAKIFYEKAISDRDRKRNDRVEVINALLEEREEQLKKYHFDFILVSSVLHEIPDQKKFLQTLYNISNETTVVHFNVPNAHSFHRLLAVEMGLIRSEFQKSASNLQFQQHMVFDLPLLTRTIEESNFKVIENGSYSFKPFTHLQMQKMIDAGLITEQMLAGFYKMEKHIPDIGSEIFVNVKKRQQ